VGRVVAAVQFKGPGDALDFQLIRIELVIVEVGAGTRGAEYYAGVEDIIAGDKAAVPVAWGKKLYSSARPIQV
jgi:hypothetical protein